MSFLQTISGLRERMLHPLAKLYLSSSRGRRAGVRAACFDREGRIFLVRHSYLAGWHMPGGGIERGETTEAALARELSEEGNLAIMGAPRLIGVTYSHSSKPRDAVFFYSVFVDQTTPRKPDWEIVESGFYRLDALPDGVAAATLVHLQALHMRCDTAFSYGAQMTWAA